jgi:hypothetical protein
MLTADDIRFIMDELAWDTLVVDDPAMMSSFRIQKRVRGYHPANRTAQLQAKLSIMLEAKVRSGEPKRTGPGFATDHEGKPPVEEVPMTGPRAHKIQCPGCKTTGVPIPSNEPSNAYKCGYCGHVWAHGGGWKTEDVP